MKNFITEFEINNSKINLNEEKKNLIIYGERNCGKTDTLKRVFNNNNCCGKQIMITMEDLMDTYSHSGPWCYGLYDYIDTNNDLITNIGALCHCVPQFNAESLTTNHFSNANNIFRLVFNILSKINSESHKFEEIIPNKLLSTNIVFIDGIDTGLDIKQQSQIMNILIVLFPNTQFITTTTSPFVVNSSRNSVVYNLVNNKTLYNSKEYSLRALLEGFFEMPEECSYLKKKLTDFKLLLEKDYLCLKDIILIKHLYNDFKDVSEISHPNIKNEFYDLCLKHSSKIEECFQPNKIGVDCERD